MFSESNRKFSHIEDDANQRYYNQRIRLVLNLLSTDYIDYQPENPMRLIKDLGPRLNETLLLACSGLSNRGIAKILGINNKTVESRFSQLFDYFNIDTKVENNDNPRMVLFISAYCRGNATKAQLKRLYKETYGDNLAAVFADTETFVHNLEINYKSIG